VNTPANASNSTSEPVATTCAGDQRRPGPLGSRVRDDAVVKERRLGPVPDQVRLGDHRGHREVERALAGIGQKLACALHQQTELDVGMRRPDMGHDPTLPTDRLGDLHSRRPEAVRTRRTHGTAPT
jgi:hypothetical protein